MRFTFSKHSLHLFLYCFSCRTSKRPKINPEINGQWKVRRTPCQTLEWFISYAPRCHASLSAGNAYTLQPGSHTLQEERSPSWGSAEPHCLNTPPGFPQGLRGLQKTSNGLQALKNTCVIITSDVLNSASVTVLLLLHC